MVEAIWKKEKKKKTNKKTNKKKPRDARDKVSNTRQSQSKVFTGLYQLLRRGLLIAREGFFGGGLHRPARKKCARRVSSRAKVHNPLGGP